MIAFRSCLPVSAQSFYCVHIRSQHHFLPRLANATNNVRNSPANMHVCELGMLDPIVLHRTESSSCAEAGFSPIVTQAECQQAASMLTSSTAKVKSWDALGLPYCGRHVSAFTFNMQEIPETRGRYDCSDDRSKIPDCVCKQGMIPLK